MGLSSELSSEAGSFSYRRNPYKFLSPEVLRLYFPSPEPWVAQYVLLPSCSSRFICVRMWDCLVLQLPPGCKSPPPGCPSPPLLPVWVSVSSLTPSFLDFHTVLFSGSSGCFLFLNCCCARRQSVSTYASIWAGSPVSLFFRT